MDPMEEYRSLQEERPEQFRQDSSLEIVLDEGEIEEASRRLGRDFGVVYKSPYNMVVVDLVRNLRGDTFAYERLMPSVAGEAVVTIPRFHDKFILLDHFRHAMRGSHLCFPRGYGEKGVTAADNAVKELTEELGVDAGQVESTRVIGSVVANSGISGEKVKVVLCDIGGYGLEVGREEIEGIVTLTDDEMGRYIGSGLVDDGFTLSAWALYKSLGPDGAAASYFTLNPTANVFETGA